MAKLICSQQQLTLTFVKWCEDGGLEGTLLRFGQLVYNMYCHDGPWPELLYCDDTAKAFVMALEACT